jgi:hypothetical protein
VGVKELVGLAVNVCVEEEDDDNEEFELIDDDTLIDVVKVFDTEVVEEVEGLGTSVTDVV